VLTGITEYDTKDWKANTEYRNCESYSIVISHFWQWVNQAPKEMKAKLLIFVTGTSKIPSGGFSCLRGSSGINKFTIQLKDDISTDSLPRGHTCFNRIDLPNYSTFKRLKTKLEYSILNCIEVSED